jgi:pimeloyl-ACP methyl ester carboxylesterase
LDTSARPDTPEQKQRRTLLIAMSSAGQFKGVTPRLLPMLIHPDRLEDRQLTGIIMGMAERVGHDAFRLQQNAILNREDSRPSLKHISCPVQLIVGKQDALTPPDVMREIADAIPKAHYNLIDHCGHLSSLETPDEVTKLMTGWLLG